MGAIPIEVGLYTHVLDLRGESETSERTGALSMLYFSDLSNKLNEIISSKLFTVCSFLKDAIDFFGMILLFE